VQRHGTNPVQGDEVPCQRGAHNAHVNGTRRSRVLEVDVGEVRKVEYEQELCEPEVASHPEVYKAEEEQVVGDEVEARGNCGVDVGGVVDVEAA
jgi:hypothetical protein